MAILRDVLGGGGVAGGIGESVVITVGVSCVVEHRSISYGQLDFLLLLCLLCLSCLSCLLCLLLSLRLRLRLRRLLLLLLRSNIIQINSYKFPLPPSLPLLRTYPLRLLLLKPPPDRNPRIHRRTPCRIRLIIPPFRVNASQKLDAMLRHIFHFPPHTMPRVRMALYAIEFLGDVHPPLTQSIPFTKSRGMAIADFEQRRFFP